MPPQSNSSLESKNEIVSSEQRKSFIRKYIVPLHPLQWLKNNLEVLKQASKMAAAPTLINALIFSNYWINYFKEFMYIMAILAHFSTTPGFPRAKLIMFNFPLIILLAVAYCWTLLGGYCALKARESANEKNEVYSASASAVIAIFMCAGCFLSYAGRSADPKHMFSYVLVGIYFVATMPALIELRTMREVINVSSLILESFYVGMAIGIAIGLLIFPRSCRNVFMKAVEDSLRALQSVVRAQPGTLDRLSQNLGPGFTGAEPILAMKARIEMFTAASTRAQANLELAGQEWTHSRYNREDLQKMAKHLTMISAPLIGLKSLADSLILAMTEDFVTHGEAAADEHREFTLAIKDHADELIETMDRGIDHVLTQLGSIAPKEHTAGCLVSDCQHVEVYQQKLSKYRSMTGELTNSAETYLVKQIDRDSKDLGKKIPYGALVGLFLSSHFLLLLSAAAFEFHEFIQFFETASKKRKKIHTPIETSLIGLKEWLNTFRRKPVEARGVAFSGPVIHDVDHLPATTRLERFGNIIRRSWKVFGSQHAGFGLRGVCAIMTIAILAYLKDEHGFYNEYRFLWALFSIVLCLDRTAGSSTLKLVFRFFATLMSMVASYIIWYIVDQKTAGIIVLFFFWYVVLSYFQITSPKYGPAGFTAAVAATVMIDNQLQVRKIGPETVAASGEAVYGSYIIFPLRLAQVTLGIFAAYFWTLFPTPMPEHTELRLEASEAMLNLATFNTSIHQSVGIQFGGHKGLEGADTHLHRLRKRHRSLLTEHNILITRMQTTMKTIPFEFNLGGKFPLATYKEICTAVSQLGDLFTLMAYVSHQLNGKQLAAQMNTFNSHLQSHLCPAGVGTRLVVLCSVLRSGHPLPPGMNKMKVPDLRHFLDRRVATDESFASASLIHTANFMVMNRLNELTRAVAEVVGTLDFSLPLPDLEEEV